MGIERNSRPVRSRRLVGFALGALVAIAASQAITAAPGPVQGEPLLFQVARHDFDAPFDDPWKAGTLAITSDAGIAFSLDNNTLITIDRRTGRQIAVRRFPYDYTSEFRFLVSVAVIAGRPGESDLLVLRAHGDTLRFVVRVYDLTDPANPEFIRELKGWNAALDPIPVPGLAITRGALPGAIVDARSGEPVVMFDELADAAFSTTGDVLRAAILAWDGVSLWNFEDLQNPVRVGTFPASTRNGVLGIAPSGRVAAYLDRALPFPHAVRLYDVVAGLEGAIVPPASGWIQDIVVADGPDGPVLGIATSDSIVLYDVRDVTAPREAARPAIALKYAAGPCWWASNAGPFILASDRVGRRFVVLDAGDGRVVAERTMPESIPSAFFRSIGPDQDEIALVAAKARVDGVNLQVSRVATLLSLQVDAAGTISEVSEYGVALPRFLDHLATVGGRFVLGYDDDRNVLVVFDAARGVVTDAVYPAFAGDWSSMSGNLDARDGCVVVGAGISGQGARPELAQFDLDLDGRLHAREPIVLPSAVGSFYRARCGPNGTLFAITRRGLFARTADGTESFTPIDDPYGYGEFEISADGRRALLTQKWFSWAIPDLGFVLLDIRDPHSPVVLARSEGYADSTARLVSGGRSVLATFTPPSDFRFRPRLYDAETGVPASRMGEAIPQYFFHGPGTEFGSNRFVYWSWTWTAWQSHVVDFGSDPPRLLSTSWFEHDDPSYAPRPGHEQAYLVAQRDDWDVEDSTSVWLVEADGTFVPRGGGDIARIAPLRHGFLGAVTWGSEHTGLAIGNGIGVLRDRELNRPPATNAGPDEQMECVEGGADVRLDGSGSFDPDSTPGTTDDVASVRWELDGAHAADTLVATAHAPAGIHEARLLIEDVLGVSASDTASITIADSLAPDVSVALEPSWDGSVWRNAWSIDARANDLCDGAIAPAVGLTQPAARLTAPTIESDRPDGVIQVFEDSSGTRVEIRGASARAAWAAAKTTGYLALDPAQPIVLTTSTGRLVAEYRIDARGYVVAARAADHLVEALATDRAHRSAHATSALSTRLRELCATLPKAAACTARHP